MADVFISYSRKDKDFVRELHDALGRVNRDSWVDWKDIPPTAEWLKEIRSGIESADTFIFIISPDSASSKTCTEEITHAAKHNKRLVPIVRRDVGADSVPPVLASLNWIFFRESDDFDSAFQSLIQALDTDLNWVHAHTRLLTRALEWDGQQRDRSFVLRGSDLKEAELWLTQSPDKEPKPTSLQAQYIIASRKAATRRQRLLLGAVTLGLTVAIVLAIVAFYQYRAAEARRRTALSRQLAAQALNHLNGRLDLALLLSLEAYKADNTIEARSSLLTGLQHNPHLVTFLRGAAGSVGSVAFSPDGKTLASAHGDRIILWDIATAKPDGQPLIGHTDAVFSLAFSPDGKMLASSSRSRNNLILWDVVRRQPLGQPLVNESHAVATVAFSPDGKTLASAGGDQKISLWDLATRKLSGEPLAGHQGFVQSLAFSPDGKLLASGSHDRTVILWDAATHQPRGQPLPAGGGGQVESVAFNPEGTMLAAGGGGGITLWDAATGQAIGEPLTGHVDGVKSVAFSPDGKILASGGDLLDKTIMLWDVVNRERLGTPLTGHTLWVSGVAFSPDGRMLASGGGDETIILWDVAASHRLGQSITGHTDTVDIVTFSPDGKTLASGSSDKTVSLWNLETGKALKSPFTGHTDRVRDVVFISDGKAVVSGSCGQLDGKSCRIDILSWDVASGQPLGTPRIGDVARLDSLTFSPDGKTVAAGSCTSESRKPQWSASCDQGEVRLWNMATGHPLGNPLIGHKRFVLRMVFAPDGKTIASSSLDEIILWDLATGKPLARPIPGYIMAFSADGKMMASSAGHSVVLRDAVTAKPLGEPLTGANDVVLSLVFSPDGRTLAATGTNLSREPVRTITLWDVPARERLGQPLVGHTDGVVSIGFSPDGKMLASGSKDKTIIVWDVSLDSWRDRACRIANRNLSYEEWKQSMGAEPYRVTCPSLPVHPSLLEAGQERARAGDVDGAVAIFQRALELDPTLNLNPRVEAEKVAVPQLVEEGRNLARDGNVDGAIALFQKARALDSGLKLDPKTEARKLAAPGWVTKGEQLAGQGQIKKAIEAYAQAGEFDPALKIPAESWNNLCRSGSLWGHATDVLDACDRAVMIDPDNGGYRDSRGLARALTKDIDRAIEDFQAFIAWEDEQLGRRMGFEERRRREENKAQHQLWIDALRSGKNPFTPEEIQKLREQ